MKGNNKKGCLGVFLVILVAILSFSCSSESTCEYKKCSNFSSQSEAQSTFESDKNCYSNLDRDNDNIACEN
ncbi:excalibur calcium-binding domain-containing protein [Cellulophaga baltica]|nr:excalibur calcium-binding domain-containing protein [Cellulophaga baltica]